MQAVVELPEFQKKASRLLKSSEKISIINYLAFHPLSGEIMQGQVVFVSCAGLHMGKVKVAVPESFTIITMGRFLFFY